MAEYKKVKVTAGPNGYGGPLIIEPSEAQPYIGCMTGMGIHKVAKEIAAQTGGQIINMLLNKVPYEQLACIVLDCAGGSRGGSFPEQGVKTIDIHPIRPTGPRADKMTPDIIVTGVNKPQYITPAE